jgi:DNA primase
VENLIIKESMPERIHTWLKARGITDSVLTKRQIGYGPKGITIPVIDEKGVLLFNKYRRDPESESGPKYIYDAGSHAALYCRDNMYRKHEIVICEGELDCLLLESKEIFAVTSTGGAGTFSSDWLDMFTGKDVYVCMDNDEAGRAGIIRICRLLPSAKVIPLPPDVGDHGDVTDFFVKLGKSADDFRRLMSVAEPMKLAIEKPVKRSKRSTKGTALEIAKKVPLDEFLKFNGAGFASCPGHKDKTPSLKKDKHNRWYCHSCGKWGDTVDLVMLIYEIKMKDAIELINERK